MFWLVLIKEQGQIVYQYLAIPEIKWKDINFELRVNLFEIITEIRDFDDNSAVIESVVIISDIEESVDVIDVRGLGFDFTAEQTISGRDIPMYEMVLF